MQDKRLPSLSECMVFFDFDNTITLFDILDDIIKLYSINKDWVKLEKAWREGKIGSRECLQGELKNVRVTKKELLQYLSGITIDPHFHKLLAMLRREGIRPIILSDNFKFIIESILKYNGVRGIKVYANNLKFNKEGKLTPTFPYGNRGCLVCAHCKKKYLLKKNVKDKIVIYIGDGLSDICPVEFSHLVFAKGTLLKYLRKTKRLCMAFDNLEDIEGYFRGLEK